MAAAYIEELLGADLVIEMNHPVSIAGHLPEKVGILTSEDLFLEKPIGDFLIFSGGMGEFSGQDVPPDVEQRLESPPQIGLGGGDIVRIAQELVFILDGQVSYGRYHLLDPLDALDNDALVDLSGGHFRVSRMRSSSSFHRERARPPTA